MKSLRTISVCLLFIALSWTHNAFARDDDAAVVYVRSDVAPYLGCFEEGVRMKNCFKNMTLLQNWVFAKRQPTVATPLLVDIGPGTFGPFLCIDMGGVTLRGAGPNQTTLDGTSSFAAGITGYSDCENLHVQDIRIAGNTFVGAARWFGPGGSSTWSNVHVFGSFYGWAQSCSGSGERSSHQWFSSRIGSGGKAYAVGCSEDWLIGTRITAEGPGLSGILNAITIGDAELHVYGGNIAVIAIDKPNPYVGNKIKVISDSGGSEVHIHGTGMDGLAAADDGTDVVALSVGAGSMFHVVADGYNLNASGAGTVIRISNNGGTVNAPYQWQTSSEPPAVISEHGADTAVVTNNVDGQPHAVVYSTNCASSWFDMVTGLCRP